MTPDTVTRRVPFWILFAGSLALTGYGVWAAVSRITGLEVVLTSNAATTADVYGGQAWAVLESGLAVAGIVGLVATFAVWALASRTPATRTAETAPAAVSVDETPDATAAAPAGQPAPAVPATASTDAPDAPDAPDASSETVAAGQHITRD